MTRKPPNSEQTLTDAANSPTAPLHHLREVRLREEVSLRTMSRRLGVRLATVKEQESCSTDIPLSVLYQWQSALGVPAGELLVDGDDPLSSPKEKRDKLLQLMKTASSLSEQSKQLEIRRMIETIINQLIEIMPELDEAHSEIVEETRRKPIDFSRMLESSLPESMFTGGENRQALQ